MPGRLSFPDVQILWKKKIKDLPSNQIACKGSDPQCGFEKNLKDFNRLNACYFNLLNHNIWWLVAQLFKLDCL